MISFRGLPVMLSGYLPGQEEGNVPYVVNGENGHVVVEKTCCCCFLVFYGVVVVHGDGGVVAAAAVLLRVVVVSCVVEVVGAIFLTS